MELFISGIIAAIVGATVGGIVSYLLNVKTQKKHLENQIINEARIEISYAIREYRDWLFSIYCKLNSAYFDVLVQQFPVSDDYREEFYNIMRTYISDEIPTKWIRLLEEYEVFFEGTENCRRQLDFKREKIGGYLLSFFLDLQASVIYETEPGKGKEILECARENANDLKNLHNLIDDFLFYFQNYCFHKFSGKKMPERRAIDLSISRIDLDRKGKLKIIEPNNIEEN